MTSYSATQKEKSLTSNFFLKKNSQRFFTGQQYDPIIWLPQDVVMCSPGDWTAPPPGLIRTAPHCECSLTFVQYFHDKDEAKTRGNGERRRAHQNSSTLGSEKLIDSTWLIFNKFNLETDKFQWTALCDIFNNLLFAVDSAEQESIDRLETVKYKAQLHRQTEENKVAAVHKLQATVR